MIKKVSILIAVMMVAILFVAPIHADPMDTVLDQQVTLGVPGKFELIDANQDQQAEALNVKLRINSYREGDFIVTGRLEAMQGEQWVEVGVTVQSFHWSTKNATVELKFHPDLICANHFSGPYRASVSVQDGDWELPMQVVGFSPSYSWNQFQPGKAVVAGIQIADAAQAKRAVELWAQLKSLKLGNLLQISYNFDHWRLDYQNKRQSGITRLQISPQGQIEMMKIKPAAVSDAE